MSIIAEMPGIFQVLSDYTVKRFPVPTAAASPDFTNGYKSKDVVIDDTKPVTARIFVPDTGDRLHPLPIIVYFHGGGFYVCSTTWSSYDRFLGDLCVKSQALILSVDYRLAPEHKIPAAYDDCYSSLQWLASNSSAEAWLERADLSRVFLSGESAGGNIVHHVMLRVIRDRIEGVSIVGLMITHPFFGGEERLEYEKAEGFEKRVRMGDVAWRLSLPEGADRDHWASNFEKGEAEVDWRKFPAATVFLAGLDLLKERGIKFAEFLEKKGVEVEVAVTEGQDHAFHIVSPDSQAATRLLQGQIAEFVNRH